MKFYTKVWGDLACFTDPLTNVERMSYPFMTPSAARGILESILYHQDNNKKTAFRHQVEAIAIKKPIKYISIRRNEVKSKISRNLLPILIEEDRTQRMTTALRDVEYVIKSSIVNTTDFVKYKEMFSRRLENGQCFHQPCFGCREFVAFFEPSSEIEFLRGNIDKNKEYGIAVYDNFDLDSNDCMTTVFNATLKNGIMTFPTWENVKSTNSKLFKS